jgi:osmoprotectant transport system permease protein
MRALFAPAKAIPEVHVGSKQFTESVILGEIATQLIRQAGVRAIHSAGLGGTRMLWSALLSGDIDAYPEYTGTLAQEIFSGEIKGSRRLRTTCGNKVFL